MPIQIHFSDDHEMSMRENGLDADSHGRSNIAWERQFFLWPSTYDIV